MKSLDLFSNIIGLKYSNSWRYKTIPGAVVSIFSVISSFAILSFYLTKFFKREEVNSDIENFKYWNPPS
jgi:hypothetical protein